MSESLNNYQPTLQNYYRSLIAGEVAIAFSGFWDNLGAVGMCAMPIEELDSNLKTAFEVANQPVTIEFGLKKQQEGRGCLGIMDRLFRASKLGIKVETDCHYIFDWYQREEARFQAVHCNRLGSSKELVFASMLYAIDNVNPERSVPCFFAGVPTNKGCLDLLFVCDRHRPSELKISTEVIKLED